MMTGLLYLMMFLQLVHEKMEKATHGDLVKLDQLACNELQYFGKGTGQVGMIMRCIGIRCEVQWFDGTKSTPERSVLEIVSASR